MTIGMNTLLWISKTSFIHYLVSPTMGFVCVDGLSQPLACLLASWTIVLSVEVNWKPHWEGKWCHAVCWLLVWRNGHMFVEFLSARKGV